MRPPRFPFFNPLPPSPARFLKMLPRFSFKNEAKRIRTGESTASGNVVSNVKRRNDEIQGQISEKQLADER